MATKVIALPPSLFDLLFLPFLQSIRSGVLQDGAVSTSKKEAVRVESRNLITRLQIGTTESKNSVMDSLLGLLQEDDKNVMITVAQGVVPVLVWLLDSSSSLEMKETTVAAVSRVSTVESSKHVLIAEGLLLLNHLLRVLELGSFFAKEKSCIALQTLTFSKENARAVGSKEKSCIALLALDIFKDMSLKRKGSLVEILVLWPDVRSKKSGIQAFQSCSLSHIQHTDLPSVSKNNRILSPSEVAVFLAPDSSQIGIIKAIADSMYPQPLVIFNPKWGFEEESCLGDLKGFVASFEVIYSFMGLEVKGILSQRKGMVFECVRDGVLSGEQWSVIVEEEGQMNVVSRFKSKPTIEEVENVLYNLMAINSPIIKSAKFLRDLVSNVNGKK